MFRGGLIEWRAHVKPNVDVEALVRGVGVGDEVDRVIHNVDRGVEVACVGQARVVAVERARRVDSVRRGHRRRFVCSRVAPRTEMPVGCIMDESEAE